jgi:sec-independent protein translocase protein TatC
MDNKDYIPASDSTQNHTAAQKPESDMTSWYDAAASAAHTGYEFHPSDSQESSDISEDGSPHGPLDIFEGKADDSKNEPEGAHEEPAPYEKTVPAFAAFQTPENISGADNPDNSDDALEDDAPMSILGHLNELRRRLFRVVIIVILGFVAFYGVSEPLYAFLSAPLKACMPEGSKLIYTSPQGAFFTYMKVALVASLFGTSPFSFYQLWAFIAPGLYKEEKRAVLPLAFCSSLFFLAGASFCFFLVFPIAFQFFMGFATDTIVPMISVEEYLSFALKLLIAFGIVFEMPLFAYFLSRFGILSPAFLRRSRRYAILVIFIVAAILTPPDVFSQCLMALPMLLLYEVSIYVSAAAYRKKTEKKENDQEKPE